MNRTNTPRLEVEVIRHSRSRRGFPLARVLLTLILAALGGGLLALQAQPAHGQAVGSTYVDEVFFPVPHMVYGDVTGKFTDLGDLCPGSPNSLTWLFPGTLPGEWSPIVGEVFPDATPRVAYKYQGAERLLENNYGGVLDTRKGVVILGGRVRVAEATYRCVSPTDEQRAAAFTEVTAATPVPVVVPPRPTDVPVPATAVPPTATAVPSTATPVVVVITATPVPAPVPCFKNKDQVNREVGGWDTLWVNTVRTAIWCEWMYNPNDDNRLGPVILTVPPGGYQIDFWNPQTGKADSRVNVGDTTPGLQSAKLVTRHP